MHQILSFFSSLQEGEVPFYSDYQDQYSEQDVLDAFAELKGQWTRPPEEDTNMYEWMESRFSGPLENLNMNELQQQLYKPIYITWRMYCWMDPLNLFDTSTEDGLLRKKEMLRIVRVQRHVVKAYKQLQFARISCDPERDAVENDDPDLNFSMISFESDEKRTPYQNMIWHVLQLIEQRRYRKLGEYLYEEIVTEDGYLSFAWKQVQTITEFIYENVTKELDYTMWKHSTSTPHSVTDCATHIQNSSELEAPLLNFNRRLFAFRNGIYNIEQNAFYPFDAQQQWPQICQQAVRKIQQWRPDFLGRCPCRGDVAIAYKNLMFPSDVNDMDLNTFDPASIPTPEVDQVLDDQKLSDDTKAWFFIMLGRLLYDVGEIDCWQILLFLKGVAGSGKSTIANLMKQVYPSDLVGTLSSNAEAKFGLAPLHDKKLIICPEVKDNFGVSQGDLQSMISGEDVSVPIKHRDALTVNWKTPLLFCGNELPGWKDAAGSMKRRLLCFEFAWKVKGGDPLLPVKMAANIHFFIYKINTYYLQACSQYRNKTLWDKKPDGTPILSKELHRFAEQMRITVDPLYYYIKESNEVEVIEGAYTPMNLFNERFRMFCKGKGINPPQWTEDLYRECFNDIGVTVSTATLLYEGVERKDKYIHGIELSVGEER